MFKKILTGLLFVAALGMVAFPAGNLSNNEDVAWGGRLPDLIIKSVEPVVEVASTDQVQDEKVAWGGRLPDLIIKSVEPTTSIASAELNEGEDIAWGGRLPDLIIRTQSVTHLS